MNERSKLKLKIYEGPASFESKKLQNQINPTPCLKILTNTIYK